MKTQRLINSLISIFLFVALLPLPLQSQVLPGEPERHADLCWHVIAASFMNTYSIRSDGTLWSWGQNQFGQVGDGTTTTRETPGQAGSDTDWQAIEAGAYFAVALKTNGTLWAWGINGGGTLGDGTLIDKHSPVQIGNDSDWIAISVSGAGSHTLALKADSSLWSWGWNHNGQLGDGTNTDRNYPVQVGTSNDWHAISAGSQHSLAIKTDGTLWAWGYNLHGQHGDGTTTDKNSPSQVGTDTDWRSIAGGGIFTLAIKTNGTLWAWGLNFQGQLGNGTNTNTSVVSQSGSANDWIHISGGAAHSVALKSDGTLWGWGLNFNGQIGDGSTTNSNMPLQEFTSSNLWMSIATGSNHSVGVRVDGTLWTWGHNNHYQIGDGTTVQKIVPTEISCSGIPTFIARVNSDYSGGVVSIKPNPVSNNLHYEGDNLLSLYITDAVGRRVIEISPAENSGTIYVGNLNPGIYYLIARSSSNRQQVISFIKL